MRGLCLTGSSYWTISRREDILKFCLNFGGNIWLVSLQPNMCKKKNATEISSLTSTAAVLLHHRKSFELALPDFNLNT